MTHQHQNLRRWQHRTHVLFHHQVTCTNDSCSCKCLLNLTKKKKRSELKATNPNKHCRTKDSTNFIKSDLSFHSAINSQNHYLISSHGPQTLKKQLAINQPSGSDQPQTRSFKVRMRNPQSTQDIQKLNSFTIYGRIQMLPRPWENHHHHQTLNAQTFWVSECVRWNEVSNRSWGRVRQLTETVHRGGRDCPWWENCFGDFAMCCEDLRAPFAKENAHECGATEMRKKRGSARWHSPSGPVV